MNPEEAVAAARRAFESGITKPYEFRLQQIKALLKLVEDNEDLLVNAILDDIKKPKYEAVLFELIYVKNDLRNIIINLEGWMKPRKPEKPLPYVMDEVLIYPEPYGVALVISAWNYPVMLSLAPLAGAIAAGNTAILKPSEMAPYTAKVLALLIPKYLDPKYYYVVNGGVPETTKLLEEKFDYIFYTGNCNVGKIIHQAASKHLTPVTLELGGKSPVYLDDTANMDLAAARVLFGRLANAGQSCIAPDYVLCSKEVESKFIEASKKVLKNWYGDDVQGCSDYGRIINQNHFKRITKLLEVSDAKVAIGGSHDASDLYIEPTILNEVLPSDPIMQEEIFGPVLPILNVTSAAEAVRFINEREKPLALYLFSTDKSVHDLFLKNTSSGNMLVNDTMMHFNCETIPFGGVGNSGIGGYHGQFTFDTFSHLKGTLIKSLDRFGEYLNAARYPPFTNGKLNFIDKATKKRAPIPGVKYLPKLFLFTLGFFSAVIIRLLVKYLTGNLDIFNLFV